MGSEFEGRQHDVLIRLRDGTHDTIMILDKKRFLASLAMANDTTSEKKQVREITAETTLHVYELYLPCYVKFLVAKCGFRGQTYMNMIWNMQFKLCC